MGWLNINGNWIGRHSGKSVSSYWSHRNEVLFFAYDPTDILNKVVGGQLPNQKSGATDYLTVTGVGLNARYRTPNTAAYKSADTDNCFWKTDASESTCDGNRLIAYDFTRTIVKYSNTAPYVITAIMILSSDIDTNKMRDDFDLSIWWSNVLSDYGNTKDNRAAEKSVWTAESVLDASTVALIARMTALSETPDETRQGVLDTAIKADKAASLWTKYDALWLLAAHGNDSALLNIIADEFNCTLVDTPAFTQDRGYAGNGSSDALNANYNFATDSTLFTLNACSLGIYVRTNNTTGSHTMSVTDGTDIIMFAPREADNKAYYAIGNAYDSKASTDSSGMWIISRSEGGAYKVYRNGVEFASSTKQVTGLVNAILHLLCYNQNGALGYFSNREVALAFVGGYMSQTDVTNFQTVWVDGYLASIGAKV